LRWRLAVFMGTTARRFRLLRRCAGDWRWCRWRVLYLRI